MKETDPRPGIRLGARTDADIRLHPMNAWRRVDDHVFVLTEGDEFLTIDDPVGLAVWSALAERPQSVDALTAALLEAFDVARDILQGDLVEFLETLLEHRALELVADPASGD